jgi:hypothetical protein
VPSPHIHGKRPVYSASAAMECVARALSEIKAEDRLTYADIGAVLGKSEDMAAKYCDGSAVMDFITFGRGKREWNGRFTGYFDRLCVDSRPAVHSDQQAQSAVLAAALVLSRALEGDNSICAADVRKNRAALENAQHVIETLLCKATALPA